MALIDALTGVAASSLKVQSACGSPADHLRTPRSSSPRSAASRPKRAPPPPRRGRRPHLSHHFHFDDLVWNQRHLRAQRRAGDLATSGTHHFDEVTERNLVVSNSPRDRQQDGRRHPRRHLRGAARRPRDRPPPQPGGDRGLRARRRPPVPLPGQRRLLRQVGYHDWEGFSLDYDERNRIVEGARRRRPHADHAQPRRVHGGPQRRRGVDALLRILDEARSSPCSSPDQMHQPRMRKCFPTPSAQVADNSSFAAGKMEWPALLRMADRLRGRRGGPTARRPSPPRRAARLRRGGGGARALLRSGRRSGRRALWRPSARAGRTTPSRPRWQLDPQRVGAAAVSS